MPFWVVKLRKCVLRVYFKAFARLLVVVKLELSMGPFSKNSNHTDYVERDLWFGFLALARGFGGTRADELRFLNQNRKLIIKRWRKLYQAQSAAVWQTLFYRQTRDGDRWIISFQQGCIIVLKSVDWTGGSCIGLHLLMWLFFGVRFAMQLTLLDLCR